MDPDTLARTRELIEAWGNGDEMWFTLEELLALVAEVERLAARDAQLTNAILDIDAHSTPLGADEDGFVTTGYLVSVGSLHRALGLIGHTAAREVGS
jgi:hypothetical protein